MSNWKSQRTIAREADYSGIGLHTGAMVHLKLVPAPAGTGLVFVRTDTADGRRIAVCIQNVEQKPLCTTIRSGDVYVQTVEHLLSALRAFGIDNLLIEINSIEPPGADGSAKEFCNLILSAGVRDLQEPRRIYTVTAPIYYSEKDTSIVALPNPQGNLRISYTLDYASKFVGIQHTTFELTTERYISEISAARTFCFEHEARALKEAGFGKGASTRNTCVIGAAGLLENELRYENEFVRHKILDLVGDLSVLGADLEAHLVCIKSGHNHNFQLAKLIEQAMNNQLRAQASPALQRASS